MAPRDPRKTALLIVLLSAATIGVCCGGAWLLVPEAAHDMARFGAGFGTFYGAVHEELSTGAHAELVDEDGEWVLRVGVAPGDELTPERVAEVQDLAWRIYVRSWERGGVPLARIAVGRAESDENITVAIRGWQEHVVEVDEVVRRTGIPRPPTARFLEAPEEE